MNIIARTLNYLTGRRPRPTDPAPTRIVWTAADSTHKTHLYEFSIHRAFRSNNTKNSTYIKIKNTTGYEGSYTIHELEIYAADQRVRPRIRAMARAALEWARDQHRVDVILP